MAGKAAKETKNELTFDAVQGIKDAGRFWLYDYNKVLYIFDQRISHVYETEDKLRDLILAKDDGDFSGILSSMTKKKIAEETEFISDILDISDEPIIIPKNRTTISGLKLNISTNCNMNCGYCFRDKIHNETITDIQLVCKAIDYLVNECGKDAAGYNIGFALSSEPLLHPNLILDIFKYIETTERKIGKEIEFYLITNGTILDNDVVKLVKKIRRNRPLYMSLDGPAEIHDAMRRDKSGNGTYEKIAQNIRQFGKKGIRLTVESVLTKNYPYPLKIAQHLVSLGFVNVNMKPIRQGTPYSFDIQSLESLKKGYDEYFDFLLDGFLENNFRLMEILSKDYAIRPFWRILFNHRMNLRCSWGINSISMDHKGDFYPCDSIMGMETYRVGNAAEGIDWEKFHMQMNCEIRGGCLQCRFRHICGGTCYVNGIISKNDPLAIDPVECELTRYLVEKNLVLICKLMNAGIDMKEVKRMIGYYIYNIFLQK